MNEFAANIIGSIAAICMVCGYLPQAYHTIRTQETDGIAMPTFLALGAGSMFFVVQGLILGNVPLVVTDASTTVASAIITVIKIRNDRRKRKERK